MTVHFKEVHNCVKDYYDRTLLTGTPLIVILDAFKNGPLPIELRNHCSVSNVTDAELRRHGQLVGTKYLIRQTDEQSAQLPSNDLLNAPVDIDENLDLI